MKPQRLNRRLFFAATGAGSALAAMPLHAAEAVATARMTRGLVDCQSHLLFPEVLDPMRRRKDEPLVYDKRGTKFLRIGDRQRTVPPPYVSVNAVALRSTDDPRPEWFGDDGPAVAQLIREQTDVS